METSGGVNNTPSCPQHPIVKTPSRTISVQSVGEARCPPSVIQFGVSVCSVKSTLEAAQDSVKRRVDYILQTLRNNGIKEKSCKSSTDIRKTDDSARVQTDILIGCDSVEKCETIRNFLIEKLESSLVQLTQVSYHHVFEDQEEKRQEAFKKAVANARSKAQSVSQTVGVQLGPALEVTELPLESGGIDSLPNTESDSDLLTTNPHLRFQRETLVFRSHVSVVFETQPKHLCMHKKCKKH